MLSRIRSALAVALVAAAVVVNCVSVDAGTRVPSAAVPMHTVAAAPTARDRANAARFVERMEERLRSIEQRFAGDLVEGTYVSASGASHMRIPASSHVALERVDMTAAPSTRAHRASSSDSPFVLHPAQLAPVSPSPSGLNFTTFAYPTAEGIVTLYVGITEYPVGKFHIYPAPRDSNKVATTVKQQKTKLHPRSNPRSSPLHRAAAALSPSINQLCDGVAETSITAQSYGCLFAQNAGFFNIPTSSCLGDVVSKGVLINQATSDLQGHAHFGLTNKANWVSGYLSAEEVVDGSIDGGFQELITGAGWLVREGVNYINQSMIIEGIGEAFVDEIAPRNAIGHDSKGRLLQFEADGEEDIKLGLSLREFAQILVEHFDVQNAINVDGGGSSTTAYNGAVVDHPTCQDTPVQCERAVTTISCVMP